VTRRPKLWLVVASIFTFINVVGAPFALAAGEGLHTAAHVVLSVVGVFWVWHLASRARQQQQQQQPSALPADARLEHLQQSVDAIALEVERIGEAQRYTVKLATKQAENAPQKRDAAANEDL
jgi:hypothetical protein